MNPDILKTDSQVVFFPVRHHSPTAAILAAALIKSMKPAAVLIEGPSDFNEKMDEFFLDHKLPVAIFTYFRTATVQRSAFYPFCAYSPEWVAAQTAHDLGSIVNFIDLPWRDMATGTTSHHLYADGELRENLFIPLVCKRLGLESFDELWDELIEAQPSMDLSTYMQRCHQLCYQMRHSRPEADAEDILRERFMAERISECAQKTKDKILVITGGFHSHALFERFHQLDGDYREWDAKVDQLTGAFTAAREMSEDQSTAVSEFGVALTPYSYDRLDSLTGYEAGMPSPGFYHQVYADRRAGGSGSAKTYRTMLFEAAKSLRQRKQQISSADLIAVETSALALALVRGHQHVWRNDLVDSIMTALVKDEVVAGIDHPMLTAIHDALRGDDRGRLAEGTSLPPLVHEVLALLDHYGFTERERRFRKSIELDLTVAEQLEMSRVFHQLNWLKIHKFELMQAGELTGDERGKVAEIWEMTWQADLFYASCIEAAMYGGTVEEAAANRLAEQARNLGANSDTAATLLSEACFMGMDSLSAELVDQCQAIIRHDPQFITVTACAQRLLFLSEFDQVLGDKPKENLQEVLLSAFDRAIWLLDTLGSSSGSDMQAVEGIGTLVDIYQQTEDNTDLKRDYLLEVLERASVDAAQSAIIRGAATGARWTLDKVDEAAIEESVALFRTPEHIGDFLTGLFHRARQVLQKKPALLGSLDKLVMGFSDEQFLEAVPSMRQAFAYFSPREKAHLASGILERASATATGGTDGSGESSPLAALLVSPGAAELALAIEARASKIQRLFGIRGGDR